MATSPQHKALQNQGLIEEFPALKRIARLPEAPWVGLTNLAKEAAGTLAESGRHCSPPFVVDTTGFEEKLLKAAQVSVAHLESQVRALAAVSSLIYLRRTGLLARYVNGTMVDPIFKELKNGVSFSSLLDKLDVPRADLLVLHTQNPRMARAAWAKGPYGFPNSDGCLPPLDEQLQRDLEEMLLTVGRRPYFDPVSGLVPGCYEGAGALYSTMVWPLPGSHEHKAFRSLSRTDGVLVLGSHLESTAALGLALVPSREEVAV